MKVIVSKELLSEVLGKEVTIRGFRDEFIPNNFEYLEDLVNVKIINIHELAYKCKEWAWKKGFYYWYENNRLYIKELYSCKVDLDISIGEFKKPFDVEIDFKACQWILDNEI